MGWIKENYNKYSEFKRTCSKKTLENLHRMIIQKIYSVIIILLALLTIIILDGDSTFALLIIPVGLYTLFSKKYWLTF